MIDLDLLPVFLLAVSILALTPGPDMALLIARGIGQGRKIAAFTALGFTLAGLIQIPFLAFGAEALFRAFPQLYDIVRLAGAAYLIWRGARLCYSAKKRRGLGYIVTATTTASMALWEGVISSLLNPKGFIFMVAFLPQFVNPALGNIAIQVVTLGIVLKVTALAIELSIALAAGGIGSWISRNPWTISWQERLTGVFMVMLGLRLLFSGGDMRAIVRP